MVYNEIQWMLYNAVLKMQLAITIMNNAQIRKDVFDSIFEDVGFTYNINIIGDEESIDKVIESGCECES